MDTPGTLEQKFKEADTDGDGRISPSEAYQLLKGLGHNIYQGSIKNVAQLTTFGPQKHQQPVGFTFSSFKQYYTALQDSVTYDLWKTKYEILHFIQEVRDPPNAPENHTAAPGQKSIVQGCGTEGQISLTVGPIVQEYNSYINVQIEKEVRADSKPFIKISFEQSSNQKAKQLETKLKNLQVKLFELITFQEPDFKSIVESIHLLTNVIENRLNVFITVSNKQILEIMQLCGNFFDLVIGQKITAKLQLNYQFNFDTQKFLQKQSEYSFYHAITSNYKFSTKWNAKNFRQSLKTILKLNKAFDVFTYDKFSPAALFLIALLHTTQCQLNMVFKNADIGTPELDSKYQFMQYLGQIFQQINADPLKDLGILQFLETFQNKVTIDMSLGDWKLQAKFKLNGINQIFKTFAQQNQQNEDHDSDSDYGSDKNDTQAINAQNVAVFELKEKEQLQKVKGSTPPPAKSEKSVGQEGSDLSDLSSQKLKGNSSFKSSKKQNSDLSEKSSKSLKSVASDDDSVEMIDQQKHNKKAASVSSTPPKSPKIKTSPPMSPLAHSSNNPKLTETTNSPKIQTQIAANAPAVLPPNAGGSEDYKSESSSSYDSQ